MGLFAGASPEGLTQLSEGIRVRHYEPGETIFHQGFEPAGVHCVKSGEVKVYKLSADGTVQILHWAGPGQLLGGAALQAKAVYGSTAEAVTKVEVCFIGRSCFGNLLDSESKVARDMIGRLSSDLMMSQERLMDSNHKPVRSRVAELLLAMDRGGQIGNTISRKEMSQLLGTAPETLARVLTDLQSEGLIHRDRRKIVVKARERLQAVAENEV